MSFVVSVALSSAALWALKPRKSGAEGRTAPLPARTTPDGAFDRIDRALARLDERLQRGFETWVDPILLGSAWTGRLAELGQDREIDEAERAINRHLAASGGLLATAAVNALTPVPLAPVILAGAAWLMHPVFRESWRIIRDERRFSLLHLFSIYILALWLGGMFVLGGLALVFFNGVNKIEYLTKLSARRSLTELMSDAPDRVWILVDGTEVAVAFDDVRVGDVVALRAGGTVPVDGEVVEGAGLLDQHRLTGESQPVEIGPGDAAMAGALLLGGSVRIRVQRTGADTVAARIRTVLLRTVEQNELRMGDRFLELEYTRWPMLGGGALGWALSGPTAGLAIMGCNFMMSLVPLRSLTLLDWLRAGAERGILVKDGDALDAIGRVDAIVFDKTGTLTTDALAVADVCCVRGVAPEEALFHAALAEAGQSHPIARAILAEAEARGIAVEALDDVALSIGMGIEARHDGRTIRVGGARYMEACGLRIPPELADREATAREAGRASVFTALDGEAIAVIVLAARLRPGVRALMQSLKRRGIEIRILSGDHESPTRALAASLGVDGYRANCLPEQKSEEIKQLQARGKTVCFVGDGVNDAVALRAADVSVSLAGATTVATDAADVVLMRGEVAELEALWSVAEGFARRTDLNARVARTMSATAATMVILFPFKFLIAELMWLSQAMTGVWIAQGGLDAEDDAPQPDGERRGPT